MNKTFFGAASLALISVAVGACTSENSGFTPTADGGGVGPVADGGTDGSACATMGQGTLTIDVVGLPAGANARVTAGTMELAAPGSTTLEAGVHSLSASIVTLADPRIRTALMATLSASSTCVKNGETQTITVTYSTIQSSHKLYVTNANKTSTLLGFPSSGLVDATSPTADVQAALDHPNGIAFDKEGGLWTPSAIAGTVALAHYPASIIGTGDASKTPDVVIGGADLNAGALAATGLAFDPNGNLWVSTPAANKILRYDAASLRTTGSPAPSVVISNVVAPSALAFDEAGNLWACETGLNRVVEYAAAKLTASVAGPADIVLTGKTPLPTITDLIGPRGLAFDGSKNLWVNFDGRIVRLSPLERSASADLTPAVQIEINAAALVEGLAFDEGGGLWFAYTESSLARLSPSQLATSTASGTSANPDIVVASNAIGSAGEVALFPAPATLPIYHRLP